MESDKQKWAVAIGRLIVATNEIDHLLHTVQRKYFEGALSNTWLGLSYSQRLEKVAKRIHVYEEHAFLARLEQLVDSARGLVDVRNHVAHGTFVLDADKIQEQQSGLDELSLMLYDKSLKRTIVKTFQEIVQAASLAMRLSQDLSKLVSISQVVLTKQKSA